MKLRQRRSGRRWRGFWRDMDQQAPRVSGTLRAPLRGGLWHCVSLRQLKDKKNGKACERGTEHERKGASKELAALQRQGM